MSVVNARDQLNSFLHDGDQAIWSTAAVVLAMRGTASGELQAAAQEVLKARAVDEVVSLGAEEAAGLAAQAAAPIHQVAALHRAPALLIPSRGLARG